MSKRLIWTIALFVVGLFIISTTAFAAVTITDRTGTLRITMPDGTVVVVGPTETLPYIPVGSTIEILSGTAEIASTGGSCYIIVGDVEITIEDGEAAKIGIDSATGKVTITSISGTISGTDAKGNSFNVSEGLSFETEILAEVEAELEVEIDPAGDLSPIAP